jgi:P27 family predicted phage terminase small subunit
MTTKKPNSRRRPDLPKSPRGLSAEARGWWQRIVSEWALDDAGLLVLQQGLEAFDRMRQAQAVVTKEGLVVSDRFGQPKQHPATLVERDNRTVLLRAFKQLGLDVAAPATGKGT